MASSQSEVIVKGGHPGGSWKPRSTMKSSNCPGKKQGQLDYIISSNSSSKTLLSTLEDSNSLALSRQSERMSFQDGRGIYACLYRTLPVVYAALSRMVVRCHLMLPLALDLGAEHYVQQGVSDRQSIRYR